MSKKFRTIFAVNAVNKTWMTEKSLPFWMVSDIFLQLWVVTDTDFHIPRGKKT